MLAVLGTGYDGVWGNIDTRGYNDDAFYHMLTAPLRISTGDEVDSRPSNVMGKGLSLRAYIVCKAITTISILDHRLRKVFFPNLL